MNPLVTKNINFFVNVIVHIFILLTIISTFFFLYISKLGKEKFHNEIEKIISNNMNKILRDGDKEKYIKNLLKNLDLEKGKEIFNKPEKWSEIQNNWLVKITGTVIFILILIMIIILFIVYLFGYRIPIESILKENIILFSLIGTVEIGFFFFIARYFIPTKPSLLLETLLNNLKTNFKV